MSPSGTCAVGGEIPICTFAFTVAIADAAFDASATGVAITTTEFGEGAIVGAVYVAAGDSVEPALLGTIKPHAAPVQPGPDKLHATAKFGVEPAADVNAAWNVAAAPELTDAGPEMATVKPLAIVSVTLPLTLVSATLVAVIVALAGCGKFAGAV